MYGLLRKARAADCLVLPAGIKTEEAASAFVNPLTALGMLETARREAHKGLVHTAAAPNLGQILNRLCQADGIPLVNIVRSEEQVQILKGLGAKHIVNSAQASFRDDLVSALKATGATLAFDAIGGGKLAGQILMLWRPSPPARPQRRTTCTVLPFTSRFTSMAPSILDRLS
jgi:NADPH:quinone reductase-like Zn-dependent oxidoreductase